MPSHASYRHVGHVNTPVTPARTPVTSAQHACRHARCIDLTFSQTDHLQSASKNKTSPTSVLDVMESAAMSESCLATQIVFAGVDCHYAFRTAQTSCRLILPSAASRLATMSRSGTCRQAHDSRHACFTTKAQCVTCITSDDRNPQKVTFASHRIMTMRHMGSFQGRRQA